MSDYRLKILPLALGTFAVGTEDLVISGILPQIADSFSTTASIVGQLVTVFAIVYALSGPFSTAFFSRFDQKMVLMGSLAIFFLANVGAALAPSLFMLGAVRVVAALCVGIFVPTASAAGAKLAPAEVRGQALALVWGGFTVATVLGVPLGTLLGAAAGWRVTFAAVAVLSAVAFTGIATLLPKLERPPVISAAIWLSVIRRPQILTVSAISIAMMAGQFTVFIYLAPITERITGFGTNAIAAALFIFGLVSIGGNYLGGIGNDKWGARPTVITGLISMFIAFSVIGLLSVYSVSTAGIIVGAAALIIWSLGAWAFVPPQQSLLLEAAPEANSVALSLNSSSFYIGIAIGGAIGGFILNNWSVSALGFVGSGLQIIALGILLLTGSKANHMTEPQTKLVPATDTGAALIAANAE